MNIKIPEIKAYPAHLPPPTKVGYGSIVDYGVTRSTAETFPDQNRYRGSNPTMLTMEFRMHTSLLNDWCEFLDQWAIDRWVSMNCVDQYAGFIWVQDLLDPQIVRFVDYQYAPLGADYWSVQANVEVMPQDIGDGLPGINNDVVAPVEVTDWIVAGTPDDPSPDWIEAGDPATPSPDWVDSQAPADHRS